MSGIGRRHDATGRSTGRFASSKFRKLNSPPKDENWIWLTREMLESPAWRALSSAAQKVICRIAVEHMAHGGGQNGDLPVTYNDFRTYGVRGSSIAVALAEAIELGFIERVDPGRRAWGEFQGKPATYRLSWLPTAKGAPAPNRWKRFRTLADARTAAERAKLRKPVPLCDRTQSQNGTEPSPRMGPNPVPKWDHYIQSQIGTTLYIFGWEYARRASTPDFTSAATSNAPGVSQFECGRG
jgi:hypothetical protein